MKRVLIPAVVLLLSGSLSAQSEGIASYYHMKFAGRITASGEVFNPDSLTAAHKTLPFGTRVRVTDKKTGHAVIVRINDRLPQSSRRTIDLSPVAARELSMIRRGLAAVRLDILGD